MGNGLCIFCEEKDSPEHQLKHKRLRIVFKECDNQPLDEDELVEPVLETSDALLNPDDQYTLQYVIGLEVEAMEKKSSAQEI